MDYDYVFSTFDGVCVFFLLLFLVYFYVVSSRRFGYFVFVVYIPHFACSQTFRYCIIISSKLYLECHLCTAQLSSVCILLYSLFVFTGFVILVWISAGYAQYILKLRVFDWLYGFNLICKWVCLVG